MAPRVPDEIDVFTVPHSRMKELVNIYTQKMQCVDFRDGSEVVSLLQDLDLTLYEFKSHESIENIFIMDQLKNRLKQHQIQNTAVCDCHNDNRLSDMVRLVRTGTEVNERSIGERLRFGCELQEAFKDFKAQEEEPETNRDVKVLRDLNLDLCSLWDPCEAEGEYHKLEDGFRDDCCSKQGYDQVCVSPTLEIPPQQEDYSPDLEPVTALSVPTEILLEIFSYLSPAELGQCAQVCWAWNNAAFSPPLWKAIYPVQWARGIWKWHDVGLTHALEDAASGKVSRYLEKWDEDADIDEAEEERDPQADKECFVMERHVLRCDVSDLNTLL
ncbi:F-box/LRR-repeat protein 5 [Penaeus vannamei]|uniref:F-box/LRR-repeat protein 5 n=1 Tax=Penaeus vannamei TaxID=6689 RepID=A0A3R7LYN5_PENVA|nr:F-box/LRR-repeat protein 5 [Penaeus vannamei]